jgi:DNA replication protein DnaC
MANYCQDCWNAIQAKQEAEDKARIETARKANQKAKLERMLDSARIGRRYADCTLENFIPVKGADKALNTCTEYVKDFSKDSGEGLIMAGPSGSGKSHLAVAIVKAIAETGKSAIFQSVPELLAKLRLTYDKNNDGETEDEILEQLTKCDLLVLDDIGAEKQSAWTEERLYLLIDRRYRDKRATIVTTNLNYNEIEKLLGTRAMDRLLETCGIVKLTASSYRRRS